MMPEARLSDAPLTHPSFNGSRFPEHMTGTNTEIRALIVVRAPADRCFKGTSASDRRPTRKN